MKEIDLNQYYDQALKVVQEKGASCRILREEMGIGSTLATRLLNKLELNGVIRTNARGYREIIKHPDLIKMEEI